jgi:hypothetical protein
MRRTGFSNFSENLPPTGEHAPAALKLDPMPLTVVEADRLDARITIERIGEAYRGILPA